MSAEQLITTGNFNIFQETKSYPKHKDSNKWIQAVRWKVNLACTFSSLSNCNFICTGKLNMTFKLPGRSMYKCASSVATSFLRTNMYWVHTLLFQMFPLYQIKQWSGISAHHLNPNINTCYSSDIWHLIIQNRYILYP